MTRPYIRADRGLAGIVNDPYLSVMAAIINRAWRDIASPDPGRAGDALAYFNGPNFESDCVWFNLNPAYVRRLIKDQLMPKSLFTEEQLRTIHDRYTRENHTLEALAAEYGTSAATLSRNFTAIGLPARPRARVTRAAVPDNVQALQDIARLLAALNRPDTRGAIRLTIDLDLTVGDETSARSES